MSKLFTIDGDNVSVTWSTEGGTSITEHVGMVNKTEVERIDANTVEDVIYQFDLELGDYLEISRSAPRIETLPTEPETMEQKVARIENENATVKAENSDINLQIIDIWEILYAQGVIQ